MIEYLMAVKNVNITFTFDGIMDFINNMSFPVASVAIGLLVLLAVQGYKIFKSVIYVVAAVGLGFAGHLYLAPKVSGAITARLPEGFSLDADVAIAFVCAMIGVLLAHFTYKFIVFLIGGVVGYCVGYFYLAGVLANYFFSLPFLSNKIAYIAVGCVCGLAVAIFFLICFMQLYIVASSLGCMALAGYILFKILMPGHEMSIGFDFVILGVVIGIFMMIHQFQEEKKLEEFQF